MTRRRAEPDQGADDSATGTTDRQPEDGGQTPASGEAPGVGPEAAVAAYLRTHPEFFERNPEVLSELQVPHGSGGAVSLIEHQVKVLRRQLDTERARLTHLINRAREYESLSTRLHGLVLQLFPAADLAALCDALQDALRREFNAEAVTLRLFPLSPKAAGDSDRQNDPLADAFQDFLDREHALCGPLDADKNGVLFGELGAEVRSAALIPIRAVGRSGVLAIGAADPDRFKPDMGTDLLDRLGEIVGHKLSALPPDSAPRSSRKPVAKATAGDSGKSSPTSARKSALKSPRSTATASPSPTRPSQAGPDETPETNAEAQSD